MKRSIAYGLMLMAALSAAGCGKRPQGGPRMKTYPVTGSIKVDGEAVQFLSVECHPEPESAIKAPVSVATDQQGKFAISTYKSGDGLPPGKYSLTYTWVVPGGLTAKDKFEGAYSDPKTSAQKFTVKEGDKIDLGVIELSTTKK